MEREGKLAECFARWSWPREHEHDPAEAEVDNQRDESSEAVECCEGLTRSSGVGGEHLGRRADCMYGICRKGKRLRSMFDTRRRVGGRLGDTGGRMHLLASRRCSQTRRERDDGEMGKEVDRSLDN
jgi:hypothetical protein